MGEHEPDMGEGFASSRLPLRTVVTRESPLARHESGRAGTFGLSGQLINSS